MNNQTTPTTTDGRSFERPVRRPEPMTLPWVVVAPDGVFYIGLHEDEAGAWRVALGWPDDEEIAEKKRSGWYAAQATTTWTQPNTEVSGPLRRETIG
jgi:hypothetical protein